MKPEQKGLISIIIVNWNTRDLLLDCLESITKNSVYENCEVIVFDNASSDGSANAAKACYPNVKIIESEKNLGFATGNNRAMEQASGEYILLLNPDTIVPHQSIEGLVQFLEAHKDIGIVGPKLAGSDGNTQISGFGLFPSPLEAAAHALRIWKVAPKSSLARKFLLHPEDGTSWVYVNHLLGACMLCRRSVIEQTQGFDEDFFLFLEETDLCYRSLINGWRLAYYSDVEITHLGEQSMQKVLHKTGGLYIRSYNLFCRKHSTGKLNRLLINLLLIFTVLTDASIRLIIHRNPRQSGNTLRAIWYGYVRKP